MKSQIRTVDEQRYAKQRHQLSQPKVKEVWLQTPKGHTDVILRYQHPTVLEYNCPLCISNASYCTVASALPTVTNLPQNEEAYIGLCISLICQHCLTKMNFAVTLPKVEEVKKTNMWHMLSCLWTRTIQKKCSALKNNITTHTTAKLI